VFQSYNAFPWLTVRENVAFGLTSPQPAYTIDRWLYDMGLSEFGNLYPKALSGGMRQRLAIARAMIVEPKLLLLDEPFGALDERTRISMQELLLAVTTRNRCTVLLVTHDIREAVLLSHRIIVISARPGRIQDTVESTLATPRSREQSKTPEFERLYRHVSDQWLPEPPPSIGTRNAEHRRGT
jgi:NitT/TauT family transport system ATP-binding protein